MFILPISGCIEGLAALKPQGTAAPVRQVAFYDGEVVVAGPQGYCIETASLRRSASGSFALLASCNSLTGGADQAVTPAVMTVSVMALSAGATPPSSAAISAAVAPAQALAATDQDGIAVVQVSGGGDRLLPGSDPTYWRAGMVINGHLVALAVYGPQDSALARAQGKTLILALADALQEASAPQS